MCERKRNLKTGDYISVWYNATERRSARVISLSDETVCIIWQSIGEYTSPFAKENTVDFIPLRFVDVILELQ
jgi:hypothetical protein